MKVGTMLMSSKLSANKAFRNPAIENKKAVMITTNKVNGTFWTLISVKIKEVSSNSVEVSGAKGYQPPDTLKVCLTYSDGYRGGHLYGFYGMEAVKKAEAYSHAVISRAKADLRNINLDDFTEVSTEILGSEAQFGKASKGQNNREVFVKIAVKHPSPKGVDIMLKAATGLGLSSPPGLSGFAGARPKPTPVLALFSFLIGSVYEEFIFENILNEIDSILYAGILSGGLAFVLQIYAQKNIMPAPAAIIFSCLLYTSPSPRD